ncbi:hypothetical protein DV735_g2288, partial [Chaetothyriales sp. CBS 134920]
MSTAVDNLAEGVRDVSVQDPAAVASQEAISASAAEGRRLYIGNLAYATTEAELRQFFSGYDVESTSIPVNPRTNRPVGYAFVDLKSAAEADKAIADLSGKDILERKVSVQLARKPEETKKVEGAEEAAGPNATDDAPAPLPLADVTNEANQVAGAPVDSKARGPRPPKPRGPPEDGIPSTTKVMVANLPYDLSEEKLKELFAAYEPTSAKIALRPIPRFMVKKLQARGEARKGRGFGFVTLASEELQQKAVNEMNGKEIEGREIAVKVAIDSPGKEDGAEAHETTEHEGAETHETTANGTNGVAADGPSAA